MSEPDFFKPDKNRLDEEWADQPDFFHQYAEKLADARKDHSQAEAQLEVVEAEIDKDIRSYPEKYGIEKIREEAVKNTIILHPDRRKMLGIVIDAKHKIDVIKAAVDALDHRKKALEDLVQLRLADYFAEPRIKTKEKAEKAFTKRREDGG